MEDFQHEAKKSFAIGACMYKKAYREFKSAAMYAERLPKTPENQHLLATLYANCGLIQMKRENYRTCITDCDKALAIEVAANAVDDGIAAVQEGAVPEGESAGRPKSLRPGARVLQDDFGGRARQHLHAEAEDGVRGEDPEAGEAQSGDCPQCRQHAFH